VPGNEIYAIDQGGINGMDKILIIQDSPSVNAMLKLRLESGGFSVETVETGEEGVEKAKAGRYQLILLDYNLPGINGGEVCRTLRQEDNTGNIPIVLMSAQDEGELSKITTDVGADGFISLPFEPKEFIEKITGFMESRKE
jgi:two-component system alkaline phosphatase synthesis response regulator PhoP